MIKGNDKRRARLNCIHHLLSVLPVPKQKKPKKVSKPVTSYLTLPPRPLPLRGIIMLTHCFMALLHTREHRRSSTNCRSANLTRTTRCALTTPSSLAAKHVHSGLPTKINQCVRLPLLHARRITGGSSTTCKSQRSIESILNVWAFLRIKVTPGKRPFCPASPTVHVAQLQHMGPTLD